jgi:cysteate synthase
MRQFEDLHLSQPAGDELPTAYGLRCTACGAEYPGDPFRLGCEGDHGPALLRTTFARRQLSTQDERPGVFRFATWLPAARLLPIRGGPVTLECPSLSRRLGLSNLFVSFNGFWPERGARLASASFKELEAAAVLARIPEGHERSMVVASAGNTGRAFAQLAPGARSCVWIVLPETRGSALWCPGGADPRVTLVYAGGDADYLDAIRLGGYLSELDGFFPEGGAANVARRDGMGVPVLAAAAAIGRLPDHYFQAVGSGTGGIAAWEAQLRLLEDGRFGDRRMRLHLAQNAPFTPMTTAWRSGTRELPALDDATARRCIRSVGAAELTNREPAYGIAGGVYDALRDTGGEMYAMTNEQASRAAALFEELEGVELMRPAAVALAALTEAAATGRIGRDDLVLLQLTGGGERRARREAGADRIPPSLRFAPAEIESGSVARCVETYKSGLSAAGS